MNGPRLGMLVLVAGCSGGALGAAAVDAPLAESVDAAAIDAAAIDAAGCQAMASPGAPLGEPVLLSDPAIVSLAPAIAVRGTVAVVAWHQFPRSDGGVGLAQVAWRAIDGGCVGPVEVIADPLPLTRWPSLAVSDTGFVLAYQAGDGAGNTAIHAQRLNASGGASGGEPESCPTWGWRGCPHVAAAGADYAVVWTDGTRHYFALRGPDETVAASPTGFAIQYGGLVNRPRVALTATGTVLLAWNDSQQAGDTAFEVWLAVRPRGGAFGARADVSNTPGQVSAAVSVALDGAGTLDIAWVEGTAAADDVLEATYATRGPSGTLSAPARWGAQGKWLNGPSVAPGLAATWTSTLATSGPLWFVAGVGAGAPRQVLVGSSVFQQQLARGGDGSFHLAIADGNQPARVLYSFGR